MAEICINTCLYEEDHGCLADQQAAAAKTCIVESKGKTLLEVQNFVSDQLKKLPSEPLVKKPDRPQAPLPKPKKDEMSETGEVMPTTEAKPAAPKPPPRKAETKTAAAPPPPEPAKPAEPAIDPSVSPLPPSLWRKPGEEEEE